MQKQVELVVEWGELNRRGGVVKYSGVEWMAEAVVSSYVAIDDTNRAQIRLVMPRLGIASGFHAVRQKVNGEN